MTWRCEVLKSNLVRIVLFAVFVLVLSTSGLQAQTSFGFDVDVDCKDVELRSLARSFFSKNLRDLGDVRVAEMAAPDYRIDVIATMVRRTWTMSVVITAPFAAGEGLDEETTAAVAGYAKPIKHLLIGGNSTDDLQSEIEDIVKDLDKEILKPRRAEMK
jgi:hypothetical protein